ncbi:hypothetical protein [Algicella marina]|uniref:DUF3592 domain-containing protein n=1 Tax=Algicella marina TaxID=2683284 RepID=A0A6P1SY55_9RHOB|nr:hypothetical protein [Algicella marina]QHQ35614.1 hypothetical protein GO499_10710 [Algicella marina]
MQTRPIGTFRLFMRNWGWFAAFPLLFALVFGGVAMSEGRKAERLKADGVDGFAVITDKDIEISYDSDGDKQTTYRLYFNVELPGRTLADDDSVGRKFYNAQRIGDRLPIRYWRPDPDVNEIEPGSTTTAIWITKIIAVVALTAALAWGYIAYEKAAKATRMRKGGERRRARVTEHMRTGITVNNRRMYRMCWRDEAGMSGRSMLHRLSYLEDFPEGTEIWVYADPAGRKRSWWEGDVGPREEMVHESTVRR